MDNVRRIHPERAKLLKAKEELAKAQGRISTAIWNIDMLLEDVKDNYKVTQGIAICVADVLLCVSGAAKHLSELLSSTFRDPE